MFVELCCGPIRALEVEKKIPFLCSLAADGCSQQIGVMYGVGCQIENERLWTVIDIQHADLAEWIADAIRLGIYSPGDCDLFIFDKDRLTVRLCHESDIHVETTEPKILGASTIRWLEKGFRVRHKPTSARKDWNEVGSIADLL